MEIGLPLILGVIALVAIVILVASFIINRADTRPIVSGFYGGPVQGTSLLPCGRASSEAEELLAFFYSKTGGINKDEKDENLRDLKDLLSKLCCMKEDLMAPQPLIAAVKELGFSTHMDIQPVADLTARCFSKSVPERDLSIQFEKWRNYGIDLIKRLCTTSNLNEEEVVKAESLFLSTWNDVYNVAQSVCINHNTIGKGAYKDSPHDAAPRIPEEIMDLKPYEGYY